MVKLHLYRRCFSAESSSWSVHSGCLLVADQADERQMLPFLSLLRFTLYTHLAISPSPPPPPPNPPPSSPPPHCFPSPQHQFARQLWIYGSLFVCLPLWLRRWRNICEATKKYLRWLRRNPQLSAANIFLSPFLFLVNHDDEGNRIHYGELILKNDKSDDAGNDYDDGSNDV